jgi:hypothetical protein
MQSLTLELQAAYNVFFSELSTIPGPIPAKFLSAYLQPALIRGERAQVGREREIIHWDVSSLLKRHY